jgi:site-specific DNA recombinase
MTNRYADRISALYCRVSTEEQAREGQSIENQIDRLTAYAKFQGWQNVRVFADEGESAKDMNRPEMQRLLRLIKSNHVAVVATMAVDRLSRDLLDMLQFVQLCEEHKTAYVCATLNFDTSTPIGRMVLQILAAFAEFERSMIATRVKTNMFDLAQKKRRYLACPPLGYAYDGHKNLIVVPEEAVWVQQAADRFIAGHSYRSIAKWLMEQGVPTRKGAPWNPISIKLMLTNEIYIGRLVWNRRYYDKNGKMCWRDPSEWIVHNGAHPPILTTEQWAKIQERIAHRMPKGGERQAKHRLSGLLRCGDCGASMAARKYGTKGPNKDRRIFICNNYQKNSTCWCNYVFMDEAEKVVYEALEQFAGGNVNVPAEDLQKAAQAAEREYKRRMAAIDVKFQRQIQAYENGLIGERDLRLARERLEKEREMLEQERQRATTPTEDHIRQSVLREAKQLLWLWDNGDLSVLHDTLRRIIDHIVVVNREIAEIRLAEELYELEFHRNI